MRLRPRLEPEKYVALQPRLPEQSATTDKEPETGTPPRTTGLSAGSLSPQSVAKALETLTGRGTSVPG